MKIKRDYLGMFDVARGILMLMVILGHHINFFVSLPVPSPVLSALNFAERYDIVFMGLFFIMTGYVSRLEDHIGTYVKKTGRAIFIPYFLTMAAYLAFRTVRHLCAGDFSLQLLCPSILAYLYGNGVGDFELFGRIPVGSIPAVWFLPALFWSGLIHQLLCRIKNPVMRQAAIWGLTAAAAAFPDAYQIRVPWFLVQGCAAVGFCEVGRLLKSHKVLYQKINWFFAGPVVCLSIYLHVVSEAKVWSNVWRLWMLDYLAAAAAGCVLLQLYIKSGLAAAGWADGLAYLGRYSLLVLCLHATEQRFPWYELYTHLGSALGLAWGAAFVLMFAARLAFIVAGCCGIVWVQGWLRKFRRLKR